MFLIFLAHNNAYGFGANNLRPLEHLVANLLSPDSYPVPVKLGAKTLATMPNPKADLLDLAAYQITQMNATQTDTTAWLIKALGISKRKRYLVFLQEFSSQTDNRKLIKYLNSSISEIEKSRKQSEESFSIDDFNVGLARQAIANSNAQEPFPNNHLNRVRNGETIDSIYRKLGKPSSISIWSSNKVINMGFRRQRIEVTDFTLIYDGAGDINLESKKGIHVAVKISREYLVADNDREDKRLYRHQELLTANGVLSQQIAKRLSREKRYNTKYLDIVSEKIWIERDSKDPHMIDAIAHLCRHIGNSRNSRYFLLLDTVASESSAKKIRKYAKKYRKSVKRNWRDEEQYDPQS